MFWLQVDETQLQDTLSFQPSSCKFHTFSQYFYSSFQLLTAKLSDR